MSRSRRRLARPGRPRRARVLVVASAAGLACAVAAMVLVLGPWGAGAPPARADTAPGAPTAGDVYQPQIGLPASDVTVFGAAPDADGAGGGSGEAWAFGLGGDVPPAGDLSLEPEAINGQTVPTAPTVLLQRTDASGWQTVPLEQGSDDTQLGTAEWGVQSGRVTPDGGVALFTQDGVSGTPNLTTITPGGAPQQVTATPPTLATGETLLPRVTGAAQTIPFAAIDDTDGDTGVLIAPQDDGAGNTPPVVEHYNGTSWTTPEPIQVPSGATVTPDALACGPTAASPGEDSPGNCWLLATVADAATPAGGLELFGRATDTGNPSGYSWLSQTVATGPLATPAAASALGAAQSTGQTPSGGAQMLTVTSQGLWVDLSFAGGSETASQFVDEPGGSAGPGGSGPSPPQASSAGTWCVPASDACQGTLPEPLPVTGTSPDGYLSFAWPSASGSGPGQRIITGETDGSLLEFSGNGDYSDDIATGDDDAGNASTGAAFASPTEGWISDSAASLSTIDGQGSPQVENVLAPGSSDDDALATDPVPFGSPLLAVASAPGSTPGDPNAAAIAVGLNGEAAEYVPGQGWTPQALLNGAGQTQTPTLRGVAWPEPGRAYAVGDNGAMWLFQTSTDQWEPDPAKPFNFDGNLTAVAFAPGNPDLGYAVGKGGTILQFGKTWTPMTLSPALQNVDFTSVAFAGQTAYATYRTIIPANATDNNQPAEGGGLAVNTGGGWVVDSGAASLLASLPDAQDSVLTKVAGLPDDSAVAAGPGVVIELNGGGDSWQLSPQPLPQAANISALAAFTQSNGQVGAIVSIDTDPNLSPNQFSGASRLYYGSYVNVAYQDDVPFSGLGAGSPPPLIAPDPVPDSGYLLEQSTAGDWNDLEHETFPTNLPAGASGNTENVDVPLRPDPVLALAVAPDGSEGLAVGGQTGDFDPPAGGGAVPARDAASQTGAVMRFGAGAATQTQTGTATVTTDPSQASFVLGGDAACAEACADQAGQSLAPDVSLTHAVSEAGQIQGVRAFLYSGARLPAGLALNDLSPTGLTDELDHEADDIAEGAGSLPVYVAPSSDIVNSSGLDALASSSLSSYVPGPGGALGSPSALSAAGTGYYAFTSKGASGPVMVIVLDFSDGDTIGQAGSPQLTWLSGQLAAAHTVGEPALVVGADALGFTLPNADNDDLTATVPEAQDSSAVAQALVAGGASAYLFDYPQANVQTTVSDGAGSIPAFGSGTLGYVQAPDSRETDALGSSAMLVISVQPADRNPQTNVAPVTATAVPNISALAMDATNGTLLRRSQVALFDGLARRPAEGTEWTTNAAQNAGRSDAAFDGPAPYDPIPNDCAGADCSYEIPEQFSFSSSNPSIGNFVQHDANSSNPRAVAIGSNQLPIADSGSGLFCAFNAGTTTATLTAGGLTYSLPITVQSGSVEYPCGTVPAMNVVAPVKQVGVRVPAIHTPAPKVHSPKIHHKLPVRVPQPHHHVQPVTHPAPKPKPSPRPVHHVTPVPVRHHALPTVPRIQVSAGLPPAIAPAPPPVLPRPVPPSGTSQVPSNSSVAENVPMAQREREKLAATQGVDAMTVHDHDGSLPIPGWTIGLLVLAAAAGGAGMRRRRGGTPFAWAGEAPPAGSGARARTLHRPPPGPRRR